MHKLSSKNEQIEFPLTGVTVSTPAVACSCTD